MRTAADLVDAGADPVPIVDALFRVKPRSTVCLWEKALRNVQYTGGLIWTELTKDTLERCGATASEAEGLVNFLVGTEGSGAAAILYANDNGWRVSMRSLPDSVDVANIAAEFGGGGHPRAAGVQIDGGEDAKRIFVERVGKLTLADD
jgi:phosphoesterase RecJ-like protein